MGAPSFMCVILHVSGGAGQGGIDGHALSAGLSGPCRRGSGVSPWRSRPRMRPPRLSARGSRPPRRLSRPVPKAVPTTPEAVPWAVRGDGRLSRRVCGPALELLASPSKTHAPIRRIGRPCRFRAGLARISCSRAPRGVGHTLPALLGRTSGVIAWAAEVLASASGVIGRAGEARAWGAGGFAWAGGAAG